MATERKLAAILAADIAGYSRLMEADEEATLNALRGHRELVDKLVAAHRGRIFSSAGDSVVVEFPSAVEAALCAVAVQREISLRNESIAKNKRLDFRIGINIGDVVVEDGNLFGDGVNVAARIQALADPGGICVARNVHDQIRNKTGFALEPMGDFQVKNIATPVAVYRILLEGESGRLRFGRWMAPLRRYRRTAAGLVVVLLVAAAALAIWHWQRPDESGGFPSLAVMPFSNFSNDPALDHFSDAVAESITTMLSRFPDLTVVSRNSSFSYKNKTVDVRQIGKDLGVRYVLEGSVQRKGEKLQITAQLIDTATNLHVWADEYEGNDPSTLEDEATKRLGGAIAGERGEIRKYEYKLARSKDRDDFDEYDYFLSGQEIMDQAETIEAFEPAGAVWQEGLEKFPDSALLQVSLAWYHFWRPEQFETPRGEEDFRRAEELARKALAGRNASPMVQWSARMMLAYIEWQHGDFERAVAHAEATVALAPYDAWTLSYMSRVQMAAGNVGRGIEWVTDSIARRPGIRRNTRILAWGYYLMGDYERSVEAADQHLQLSREWSGEALEFKAASLVRLNRIDEARATIARLKEVEPHFTLMALREVRFIRPYKDKATVDRELADLARAGLPRYSFDYDAKLADRLTTHEIKSMIFGHTVSGRDINSGEAFTDVFGADGSLKETADWGADTGTLLYMDDDVLCHTWKAWGPTCAALFRNPDGTREHQDEFAWVFSGFELHFSIKE